MKGPEPAGHESSTCLQIFVQEKGEQRPGRASDAYSPCFSPLFRKNVGARPVLCGEQTLPEQRERHQLPQEKKKKGVSGSCFMEGAGKAPKLLRPKAGVCWKGSVALGEGFPWILWNEGFGCGEKRLFYGLKVGAGGLGGLLIFRSHLFVGA